MRLFYIGLLIVLNPNYGSSKTYDALAVISSDTIECTVNSVRKDMLISPLSSIKSEKGTLAIDEIQTLIIPSLNQEYLILKLQLFEDEAFVFGIEIGKGLYKSLVAYRSCACSKNFRISESYIYINDTSFCTVIKHPVWDRVVKVNGIRAGISAKFEAEMKLRKFKFSEFPLVFRNRE